MALGANWHSGKPVTKLIRTEENDIRYEYPNSSRLNPYLKFDFSTTYQFKLYHSDAKIGLSIWNLLDTRNVINTYYTTSDERITKIDNESLGITPNLNFRIRF